MASRAGKSTKANKAQGQTANRKPSVQADAAPASPAMAPQDLQVARLTPQMLLRLQRTHGNAFVQRLVQKRANGSAARSVVPPGQAKSPPQVQRAVMSSQTWQKLSSSFGRMRSTHLIEIDRALAAYHKTHQMSPADQLGALEELQLRIFTWAEEREKKQSTKKRGIDQSHRATAIADLRNEILTEKSKLRQQMGPAVDPNTATGAIAKTKQLFKQAESQTRAVAATVNVKQASGPINGLNGLVGEASALVGRAANLGNTPSDQNAREVAQAAEKAIKALRVYAMGYLDRNAVSPAALAQRKLTAAQLLQDTPNMAGRIKGEAPGGAEHKQFVAGLVDAVMKFEDLATADKGGDGGDTDWIDDLLDMAGTGTSILGFQGTGGAGNEGLMELYKNPAASLQPGEQLSAHQQNQEQVREDFNRIGSGLDAGQKDKMSGSSDMASALLGMGGDMKSLIEAIKVLTKARKAKKEQKPEDMPDEKEITAARFTVAKYPSSMVATVLQFVGGALTAHRAGGSSEGGTTLAQSNFGFTASGGNDVSTDTKMAGDFAGVLTGIMGSVEKLFDLVKFIKKGGAVSAKTKRRGDRDKWTERRKDLEGVGVLLTKYTGTVSSIAGNSKSLIKLGYQIAGGGQIAGSAAKTVGGVTGLANLGGVVPVLGLINSVMGLVRNVYKLIRMGIRRSDLSGKLSAIKESAEFATLAAVEFARESLDKRIKRILINVGHALANVAASALSLTGLGTGPGMALGLASTALQLGQTGIRKAKQAARERMAKKRQEQGEHTSYEDWKDEKRLEASGSRSAAFKNWIRVAVTPNWDKTAESKEEANRGAAMELLEMNDDDVFRSLGVWEELKDNPRDYKKRVDIVVGALTKRD